MRKTVPALVACVALLVPATAQAHNHLLNPSGYCNQSGDGLSPGNSGETNFNPAGKPVGRSKADTVFDTGPARGDNNCRNSLRAPSLLP